MAFKCVWYFDIFSPEHNFDSKAKWLCDTEIKMFVSSLFKTFKIKIVKVEYPPPNEKTWCSELDPEKKILLRHDNEEFLQGEKSPIPHPFSNGPSPQTEFSSSNMT